MAESCTGVLRCAAPHWSLKNDQELLDVLQGLHQKIIEKCQETNKKMELMATALDEASTNLQNVNNKFTALSNSQFIESRVFDDDADVISETEQPKVPQEKTISEQENIIRSLQVLESLHETVTILCDSDSESATDDEDVARVILKPKDLYADRPLPHIIGSQAWKSKWHAGLLADSDSDSASFKEEKKAEEFSDSEPEHTESPRAYRGQQSSSLSSSSGLESEAEVSEQQNDHQHRTQSDIAAELARKLGGGVPKMPVPEEAPPSEPIRKLYKPHQPAPGNVFLDEPPPLDFDQSEDTDEDDIFAEINKTQFEKEKSRSNVADELFGTPIFDEVQKTPQHVTTKQKSTLFENEPEPELFADKPQPTTEKENEAMKVQDTSVKKPVGGMSLFGKANTESIGAAILKRHQRQRSPSDDDSEPEARNKPILKETKKKETQQLKAEKDIFEDLFAKSKVLEKKDQEKEKKAPVGKPKVDLFSDNIFDDIDDIFTTNVKVVSKDKKKSEKPVFDDDELFPVVSETGSKTNDKDKALFDDKLFIDKDKIKSNKNSVKESKSLFDDSDDDLFSNVEVPKAINVSVSTTKVNKDALFSDDDHLFSNEKVISPEVKPNVMIETPNIFKSESETSAFEPVSKSDTFVKSPDLFDDDEILQFTQNKSSVIGETEKELVIDDKHIFYDVKSDSIGKEKQNIAVEKSIKDNKPQSVESSNDFRDDEDSLLFKGSGDTIKNKPTASEDKINDNDRFHETNVTKSKPISANTVVTETASEPSKNVFTDTTVFDTNSKPVFTIDETTNEPKQSTKPSIAQKPSFIQPEQKHDNNYTNILDNMREVDKNKNITDSIFDELDFSKKSESKQNLNPDNKDSQQNIFDDIFVDQPPIFEKPKEPKKSKNVNALFDDDSDDESLFLKKNDVITDERPEGFVSSDDRLFGLFIDEPPAIDIDFAPKQDKRDVMSDKKSNISIIKEDIFVTSESENQKKVPKYEIPYDSDNNTNKDDILSVSGDVWSKPDESKGSLILHKEDEDLFGTPKSPNKQDFKDNMANVSEEKESLTSSTESTHSTQAETKKIGKLRPTQLNINVNTLLPGASPKKVAKSDVTDGQSASKANDESQTATETKPVKSISFEGEPNSAVLDNKLSKGRAKIQVKRRPSTRRARREAVKKSGIEFVEDTTDNTTPIDKDSSIIPPNDDTDLQTDVFDFIKDIQSVSKVIDHEAPKNIEEINPENKTESEKDESYSSENAEKNSDSIKVDITDIKTEATKKDFDNDHEQNSQKQEHNIFAKTEPITDIKSKVVYILHDEDIFDTKSDKFGNKNEDSLDTKSDIFQENIIFGNPIENKDDDDKNNKNENKGITTLGQVYKESKSSKTLDFLSDSDDDLFKTSSSTKNQQKNILKTNTAPEESSKNLFNEPDEKLFTSKNIEKDSKKISLFGSDSDEELFGGAKKIKSGNFTDKDGTSKVKDVTEKKEEQRMEEKVEIKKTSLFEDDDTDLFAPKPKKISASKPELAKPTATREVISKTSAPVFEDPLSMFGPDEE